MARLDEMLKFLDFVPMSEFLRSMAPSSPADYEQTSELPEIEIPNTIISLNSGI